MGQIRLSSRLSSPQQKRATASQVGCLDKKGVCPLVSFLKEFGLVPPPLSLAGA